ncbi:MAG TPA: hypothetical protein VH062_13530 [Polyangiaceae bacterium]|jgi:hypothetical protein|nr:hypothetical protein [Polyangiaceae bacterium]
MMIEANGESEAAGLLRKHGKLLVECIRLASAEYSRDDFVGIVCAGTPPAMLIRRAATSGTQGAETIVVVRAAVVLALLRSIGRDPSEASRLTTPSSSHFYVGVLAKNWLELGTLPRPRTAVA